jgi:hypothetical protein
MLGAQHSTPRLAKEVIPVGDAELIEEILELVEKEVDGPEVGAFVSQMRRASVAELIVVDDRTSRAGDVGHRQQIVVCSARSAVGGDERGDARREVASHSVPCFPFTEIDGAVGCRLENGC